MNLYLKITVSKITNNQIPRYKEYPITNFRITK